MACNTHLTRFLSLGAALATTSAFAVPVEVQFGSDNDGLGGFTQSTPADATQTWSEQAGSIRYRTENNGTLNSSLLRQIPLNRAAGQSYTISGTVLLVDGYADDNNRMGMYFFGDAPEVPNEDEAGAIGLIFNMDDGVVGGAPGNNQDDDLTFYNGIDLSNIDDSVQRNQTSTPFAQDLFGTRLSFTTTIDFVGTDIQIGATMTDASGDVTTVDPITVAAGDYTGDYFGFVTRSRARNFPDTAENRGAPMVVEYESFSAVPEPSSLALLALGGLALARRRR